MAELKTKQQLLDEMRSFFKKEVEPILPGYNAKRKKDRRTIFAILLVFCGIALGLLIPFCFILTLLGFLFLFVQGMNNNNEVVIDGDYEMTIKKNLMPKFLKIFGEYKWGKYFTQETKKTLEILKSLKIFPHTMFILPDDTIKGCCQGVDVEVVELKTGIYANSIFAIIILAIIGWAVAIPIFVFVTGIVMLIFNSYIVFGYLLIIALLLFIGVPFFLIRNAIVNQSMKGVLLKYTFPKSFGKHTFLFENKITSQKLVHKGRTGYDKVALEDVEFSKDYSVFSNDQVEARYLLTTSFIERFKNIETAFNPVFQRAEFRDNELYILIGTKRDLFKMGSLNEETSYAHFYKMFEEFYSVLDLIEQLKLDQKIGL